jgi:hypothetical protein
MSSKKLNIAYIGNFEPRYSTENDVKEAFEHLGHKVIALQENNVSMEQVCEQATKSDLLLVTGTWGDALPLSEFLDLTHEMATLGKPTATLHLDTFWSTKRGGRKWWREPMFHTAYIFTADGDYGMEWELLGKNHLWLPPAVRHSASKFGKERESYECDVAFVGSNGEGYHEEVWTYRKELLEELRKMCKKNNWTFRNPGGDEPKIERGDDMNDFYASAKVTVGDSLCLKKEDSRYWSDRVPEATGRGGFLIMPHIKHLKYEWSMLPTYGWGNWKQIEEMIKYYLKNEEERHTIQMTNQRITTAKHTYINRAETILKLTDLV